MESNQSMERISEKIASYIKMGGNVTPQEFLLQNPDMPASCMDSLVAIHSLFSHQRSSKKVFWGFSLFLLVIAIFFLGMKSREWMYYNSLTSLKILNQVQKFHPEDKLCLAIHFDRPMVSQDNVDKETSTPLVHVIPSLAVTTSWTSDRELLILSKVPAKKATEYQVFLQEGMKAMDGSQWEKKAPFVFQSSPLKMLSLQSEKWEESWLLNIHFDDEVSPQELEKHIFMQDELCRHLKIHSIKKMEWKGQKSCLQVQTNLLEGQKKLFIEIHGSLRGKSGPLPLGKNIVKEFSVDLPSLLIEDVSPQSPSTGDCFLDVYFSHEVNADQIQPLVSIKPEVAFQVQQKYSYAVKISGKFAPGQSYCITFPKGMKGKRGYLLPRDMIQDVVFPDRQSVIRFASSGKILNLKGSQKIMIESMNCSSIIAKVYRVFANNLLHAFQYNTDQEQYLAYSELITQKSIPVLNRKNELQKGILSLSEVLGENEAVGAYYISLEDKDRYNQDSRFILLTDLGITIKQDVQNGFHFWVTSLSQGETIPQATVAIFSNKNQKICESISDESGIAKIILPKLVTGTIPFLVQISKGNDFNVIRIGDQAWNTVRFDIEGYKTSSTYRPFLYSDRGVYRGSETVHLVCALRDAKRQIPPSFPLELRVQRPDKIEVYRTLLKSNEEGICEIEWTIPQDSRTGTYNAFVQLPGGKEPLAGYSFQVENFVPDRYKLDISTPDKGYSPKDMVDIQFWGRHLQGTPAASRKVSFEAMLQSEKFQPKEYSDYTFGNPEWNFTPYSLLKEEKILNAEGKENANIMIPEKISSSGIAKVVVQATMHEIGGRSTTSTKSVLVSPYSVYLGIQKLKQKNIPTSQPLSFEIIALDSKGNKKSLPSLEVKVYKSHWYWSQESHSEDRGYRYIRQNVEIQREQIEAPDGIAQYTFQPEEYGEYSISVMNIEAGACTTMPFYVWGGSGVAQSVDKEYVQVILDQKSYKPGDKATIQIVSPIDGNALVCLEREKVLSSQVVKVEKGIATVCFTVEKEHLPNIYCTATVVKSTLYSENPLYRAYGMVSLPVDLDDKKIEMALSMPTKVCPKEKVDIALSLSLAGKPLENAYITLAAVDEGICSLTNFKTPDPFAFFYGKEALQVSSFDVYKQILAETPPGDDSAYLARRTPSKPISGKTKSAVIWVSGLKTNGLGEVTTTLEMPDYTGQLRFMAVAFSKDAFGSKQAALNITAPAVWEISTPRFASWGDEFIVSVALMNQTGKTEKGYVQLTAEQGFKIVGSDFFSQELENNKEAFCSFTLVCEGKSQEGILSFVGSVGQEKLQKKMSLPVRPYSPVVENVQIYSATSSGRHTIKTQGDWVEGTGKVTLSVSRKPLLAFASSLEYLLQYPYGCLEQTTSKGFPLLYLDEITSVLPSTKKELQNKQKTVSYITAAIHRIAMMQTTDGAFSLWPGNDYSYSWGSVYASHFLVEARKKGYEVPESCMGDLIAWLKTKLSQPCYDKSQYEVRAYAAYILACAEKISYTDIAHIVEKSSDFTPLEAQFVYAASAKLGRAKQASLLLKPVNTKEKTGQEIYGNLHSFVRDQAISLLIALETEPENQNIPHMAACLMQEAANGRWGNTQENSWAFLALGKYFHRFSGQETENFAGKVLYGNEILAEFDKEKEASVLVPCDKESTFSIETSGSGFFCRAITQGIPKSKIVQEKHQGIQIRRFLLDKEGKPLSKNEIRHGEMIFLAIQILGKSTHKNLALEQFLPAGFEAENPRLANTDNIQRNFSQFQSTLCPEEEDKWEQTRTILTDYTEIQDDRIYLFFDLSWEKNSLIYIPLRAIIPGTFHFPPSYISCMYAPLIQGNTESGSITVLK
ncbi:MAG: alpha-2-macroglobulin family protein [Candidatus Brocadiae bacterium]|nr:alpha-2-macroglobulin family protein [Candidatus Brocadiia bacterium]